jgi:ribosome-binding factor A
VAGSRRRSGRRGGKGDRWGGGEAKRYPRSARVNEILREVLADELGRMEDIDEGLGLLTVTAVHCDPDLRRALVMFSSLGEEAEEALGLARVRLQAAISKQVRLKRTPQLRFAADPAVAAGFKVEEILRRLPPAAERPVDDAPPGGQPPGGQLPGGQLPGDG